MCSQEMANYQGDLADIVRGGGGAAADGGFTAAMSNWQFPDDPIGCSSDPSECFGDPFSYTRDPFQNMDNYPPLSGFACNDHDGFVSNFGKVVVDDEVKRPPNMFSRMLQLSPNAKMAAPPYAAAPVKGTPPVLVANNNLQISSPRNTGIKRRKSQAKKVVCIPAPAPANSRSTGEIVPSDLWAWRKYGQKPIKGSPYPRGYYRCSSSKGCSARKQVERSRTDPNMLVITYTSEHNHPWPTQRNALAGSTRSQSSKSPKLPDPKQEQDPENTPPRLDPNPFSVKEEMDQELEMDHDPDLDEGLPQSYKPTLLDSNNSEDSFFADLGEIETDPLDLLFNPNKDLDPFGFYDWATTNSGGISGGPSTTATVGFASSYGEANRGL